MPSVSKGLAKSAQEIKDRLFLSSDNSGEYTYTHGSGKTSLINWNTKYCTCRHYLDRAICKHLVGVAIKEQAEMDGLKLKSISLRSKRRFMKKKATQSDDDEDNIDDPDIDHNEIQLSASTQPVQKPQSSLRFTSTQPSLPRKGFSKNGIRHGRPPQVTSALTFDAEEIVPTQTRQTKTKRQTKATIVASVSTQLPQLRRSQRTLKK